MLSVVFEKFEMICMFLLYFFLFTIIVNLWKVNYSKNLGPAEAPPHVSPVSKGLQFHQVDRFSKIYSCTNQLLPITNEIYKSFNDGMK